MQRYRVLVALLGLALASSVLLAVAAGSQVPQGPMYSVAQVQAGLAHSPGSWLGRTVRVRGVAEGCGFPPSTYTAGEISAGSPASEYLSACLPPHLADAASPATVEALWLADRDQGRLLTLLRRVPILAWFAAAPQALRWGVLATYRVQLRAAPAGSCVFLPCYQAVLLDATP
jgi:hypothetical protein